jgi:hypothetical protein
MTDTARNRELWSSVFGAEAETWGWSTIEFLEGDWETPGRAKVTFFDPEEPTYIIATRELTMDTIWEALDEVIALRYVDACTFAPIHETCDWDACSADTLLQVAVMGKLVFA